MRRDKVFLSYAREDSEVAVRLYWDLRASGAAPWLDVLDLLPGKNWKTEISRAIRESDFFLALLSSRSVTKKGYVQKELREALEVLEEVPEGEVYVIPARLDRCEPSHPKLRDINWVDLFPIYESGLSKIIRVVRPQRAVASGSLLSAPLVDPDDLCQAGWGLILPSNADPAIMDALAPLLQQRRIQAGRFYREFTGKAGYETNDSVYGFLAKHGMGPGPADAKRVPLYLLLLGSPEEISFDFQYQLGLQYRVGRLSFDTLQEYENYARSAVEAEVLSHSSRLAVFFGVENRDDAATNFAVSRLVRPLAESVAFEHRAWLVRSLESSQATKENMRSLLSAKPAPAFLFIVAHGLIFRPDDSSQATLQGAIVCYEWPGVGTVPTEGHYFSAADVPAEADLRGMIVFHFGAFSAGDSGTHSQMNPLANEGGPPSGFVSPLTRRLLGRQNGALAVIGHIDRTWTHSFDWQSAGPQLQTFEAAFREVLNGKRVGNALQYFTQRYAELAAAALASEGPMPRDGAGGVDDELLRRAMLDSRNYILLGDPAGKLRLNGGRV